MRILTLYLIRSHVGPFVFALSALTGLLFLNAVAQRLEDLAGKGLSWDVIGEFLLLSLPHTIALTLPMAVLVAVLHAFSQLTAANEITAMKAGGVKPQRLLLPLLGVGTIVAGGMLYFNDRVLPEANHRLRDLLLDINRKSPTLILREQVVNEISSVETSDKFHIQADRIDNQANLLREVMIVDGNDPLRHRTTWADSAHMAFNEARTDLFLTLYDGVVYETAADQPGQFRTIYFDRQVVPLRGISNALERRDSEESSRSDREMTIAMLADRREDARVRLDSVRAESLRSSESAVRRALGLERPDTGAAAAPPSMGFGTNADVVEGQDELTRRTSRTARTNEARIRTLRQSVARHEVEIHKKYTLAFACIVFVLLGAPLAIRFPRGGLGMVIAASSGIFAVYWMGLIGGESLADRGVAPPAVTMWTPNVIFTVVGLWLYRGMGREIATMRGGGWDDLFFTVRSGVGRLFRRAPDRPAGAGAAG